MIRVLDYLTLISIVFVLAMLDSISDMFPAFRFLSNVRKRYAEKFYKGGEACKECLLHVKK